MKLTPAARRALLAIAKGEAVKESLANLIAFGDLARLDLIEVNGSRPKWRPSTRGWVVLEALSPSGKKR